LDSIANAWWCYFVHPLTIVMPTIRLKIFSSTMDSSLLPCQQLMSPDNYNTIDNDDNSFYMDANDRDNYPSPHTNHLAPYEGLLGWILEWPMLLRMRPTSTNVLWSFGGITKATHKWNVQYPVFASVRDIVADQDSDRRARIDDSESDCAICGTLHSTILWPMQRDSIKETLAQVPIHDAPFDDKKDKLVWRGNIPVDIPVLFLLGTDVSGVQQRVTLVNMFVNHPLVDAKFVKENDDNTPFPESLYESQKSSMADLLKCKYILAIEGKDASTDILWVLFSNSVFFLSNVTYTTWAMEDLLEPYVHYIPVHRNMSNVADQVRWAQQHPELCREIVKQSTQYVYDLFFHPDARREEEQIMQTMIHRYDQFVRQAKPIVKWEHVVRKVYNNFRDWYYWFTEDWLRVACLVVLFVLLRRM
jgi:hypothetical protein